LLPSPHHHSWATSLTDVHLKREVIFESSRATIVEKMAAVTRNPFRENLQIVARDIQFLCLLCDAGTMLNMRVVDGAFSNPSHPPEKISMPLCEHLG
jgi:hypothetical protein